MLAICQVFALGFPVVCQCFAAICSLLVTWTWFPGGLLLTGDLVVS